MKISPMAAMLVLIACLEMGHAASPPASCIRPNNSISIEWSKVGGVWHEQMGVNFGPVVYDFTCDQTYYVTTSNTTAIVVKNVYIRSTGEFTSICSRATLIDPGLIRFDVLNNSSIVIYMFPLLLSDDAYIVSNCYMLNNQQLAQLTAVLTREQTANRTYLDNLLSEANVQWNEAYYFDNQKDCQNLGARCLAEF